MRRLLILWLSAVVVLEAAAADPVVLALKWYHQFQFAGYYAALHKGFYAEEGLDVTLTTPEDQMFPVQSVLEGRADYGVTSADLVKARAEGKPVVALAAIFQHSPIVLLSRQDSELRYLSDYVGRTIMAGGEDDLPEILAMFIKEGIDPEAIRIVPHTWSVDTVINGEVDASVDYITNEPFLFKAQGVTPRIIRPVDYGVDFYGDTLFTTEEEIRRHPERVRAFRRASLRGWDYALHNVDEMIEIILAMPGTKERGKTREHLRYEAERIIDLVQISLVQPGHMNPARWERIAQTYAESGIIPATFNLDGFVFNPVNDAEFDFRALLLRVSAAALITLAILAAILLWNHRLRRAVRKKTADLRASEAYLHGIFNGSPDAIFIHKADSGRIADVNEAMCRMFGYRRDQVIGMEVGRVSNEAAGYTTTRAIQEMSRTLDEGPRTIAWHSRRADGSLFWTEVHISHAVIGDRNSYVVMARDTSERMAAQEARERLQAQLNQAQKMESVGRLAGGVAHDFNNMLGVILGNTELAMELIGANGPGRAELTEVRKAAKHSADLTRQLLAFARKQDVHPVALEINVTIEGMIKMLRRLIGETIELIWKPSGRKAIIKMDPAQLHQILANLCLNARDATGQNGRIVIETGLADLNGHACTGNPDARDGAYVCLAVTDNGCGMDTKTLERLFEPFFTTKEVGKGTGLGLAMVYGIVNQSGGLIRAISQLGEGTTFEILLPVCEEPLPSDGDATPGEDNRSGDATILLVEDEGAILRMTTTILERKGYRVLAATTPEEALRLAHEHNKTIDLLVTDMIMPGMNGHELAGAVMKIVPGIKRLFMSGYTEDVIAAEGFEEGNVHFIQKPFTVQALIDAVTRALTGNPGPRA